MATDADGDTVPKHLKHVGGQVCQICGDDVGRTVDGEVFVACDVCRFPVCRPCYEYERKDGNQSCPQCKTQYKKHRGSPPIRGEEVEDVDGDDAVSDFNDSSENQGQKQKAAERMLSWHMTYGRGEDVTVPNYDKDVPRSHIPLLTNGQVSGELSAASPDRLSMSSPVASGGGKRVHPLPYAADVNQSPNTRIVDPSREFGQQGFGNVAWKERVDGWKVKQEKNIVPMSTTQAASEGRGGGDIDASTDVLMDDSLLLSAPYTLHSIPS